jgi:soluble lytic murein transglycosylase-like protein
MRTGPEWLRVICLVTGLASAAAAVSAVPETIASEPARLVAVADSLRSLVRFARIENVPARLVVREEAYAQHLERVAAYVNSLASRTDTSATTWRLVIHLLAARSRVGEEWMAAAAAGRRTIPDGAAECAFWIGVAELARERTQSAATWLSRPVPAYLQAQADWLRVRALDGFDVARAGALALELVRAQPEHRFHNELVLRAARDLLGSGESGAALAMLAELAAGLPAGDEQLIRAQLWAARAHLDLGDRAGLHAALAEALAGGPVSGEDPQLEIRLAREALRDAGTNTALRDRCVSVLMEVASLDEALVVWRHSSGDLDPALRASLLDGLLKRLNAARREGDIALLERELEGGPDEALARRAKLEEARFRRRRGQTTSMERAYRAAAGWELDAAKLPVGDPAVGAALWEWGRELEDDGRFAEAVSVYERRAAWEKTAGDEPEAAMRAGYCAWRAGAPAAALAHLEAACQLASPRLLAPPCFWRAILAGEEPDSAYLAMAAGEERPGYAARRAGLALRPVGDDGALASPGTIWDEVAAQVRDPRDWDWPDCPPALDAEGTQRLLALIEESRQLADASILFETLGRHGWAKEMGLELAEPLALSPGETAALWRALGNFAIAYKEASGGHEEYPIAFAHAVAAAARRFDLSPAFIQAVMRQESGLDPAVRSAAGAIGLMQLMPATARRVAGSLGMRNYDLERPEDNVMLGAAHLVEQLTAAKGDVPICLASYNAGRGNAVRWWQRVTSVPAPYRHDAYLEAIGFNETRTFVRRVLRHYWAIRAIFLV